MNARIDGETLIIELPINRTPVASKSGKSLTIATTGGNMISDVKIQGKQLVIGVNAYISK